MRLILQDWFEKGRALWAPDKEDFFLFVPVFLGCGIALYFSFLTEPSIAFLLVLICLALFVLYFLRQSYPAIWFGRILFLCVLGCVAAFVRTSTVKSPVLKYNIKSANVIALIDHINAKPKKKWQLTLRPLSIGRIKPKDYPIYIRLSGRQKNIAALRPGQTISFKAALFVPARPSIPEGYDFSRRAYFQKIGAVGYIFSHITVVKHQAKPFNFQQSFYQKVERMRQWVTMRVRAALPNQEGAIAAALLTGKRGSIEPALYDDIRYSGLAHLLAISGLHMAVMAGTLFWISHLILALSPSLALSWPIRKWAVMISFIGATFYLFLSGAGIATQRAYIMLVAGFLAILFDRPALTLRNLALAACLILVLRPESLLEAGFQMSFSTTAALISFYEYRQARLNKHIKNGGQLGIFGQIKRFMAGVFLTSLIAGFAVIPFSAFHFHQIAVYSLVGNLLVMPIFVFIVMPMTLLTLILMPFGLEVLALKVMAMGLSYIMAIAHYVASWQGSVFSFPVFPVSYLIIMATGGIILVLLKSNIRYLGLLPLGLGLLNALNYQEFDLVIDEKLKAVAFQIEQPEGRAIKNHYMLLKLDRKKSRLEQWLKFSHRNFIKISAAKIANKSQKTAQNLKGNAAKERVRCDRAACIFTLKTRKIAVIFHRSALAEECKKSDIVILDFPLRQPDLICPAPQKIITKTNLRRGGAYGLLLKAGRLQIKTVGSIIGQRPWTLKTKKWRKRKRAAN